MMDFDYAAAGVPIRTDLRDTHRFIWEHLRSPGTWWTGQERVAIAAESRHALGCALCRERKIALSPNAVRGSHDTRGELPEDVVEAMSVDLRRDLNLARFASAANSPGAETMLTRQFRG